jgi:hypothetical protein
MGKRVYLATRDLIFRGKLAAVVRAAGAEVTGDEFAPDLAVVELGAGALERLRSFVARGIPTLAFGSHVAAQDLRDAREAGADAVPNSAVEQRLRDALGG